MNRFLWILAILADGLGVAYTWPFFAQAPELVSVAIGTLLLALFGSLLVIQVAPKLIGHRIRIIAKVLCFAVPGIAIVGSLDSGSISGLEAYAILFAGLVGLLNWVAFIRHAQEVTPNAAYG